jgi:hypothetical protein
MSIVDDMSVAQPSGPAASVHVVSPMEIDALVDIVARFEQQFGLSSEEMFDVPHPIISTLEETDELHAWARAWVRLNALRGT